MGVNIQTTSPPCLQQANPQPLPLAQNRAERILPSSHFLAFKEILGAIVYRIGGIAQVVFSWFDEMKGFVIADGAISGVNTAFAAVAVVKDSTYLHDARRFGLTRDILSALDSLLENCFNLIAGLMSAACTILDVLELAMTAVARVLSMISGVLCLVLSFISLAWEAATLHTSRETSKEMNRILTSQLSSQEKISKILDYFDQKLRAREADNDRHLQYLPQSVRERAAEFLNEAKKAELQKILGADGCRFMLRAIEKLRSNLSLEDLFASAVDDMRQSTEALDTKIKKHWICIAQTVVLIAVSILAIACPYTMPIFIAVTTLWVLYIAMGTMDWVIGFVSSRAFAKEEKYLEANQIPKQKLIHTLCKHVHHFSRKTEAIAQILLSSKEVEGHIKVAKDALFSQMWRKVKKVLSNANISQQELCSIRESKSVSALQNIWGRYKAWVENKGFGEKWESFKERLKVMDLGASRLYTEALCTDYRLSLTAA